MFFYNIFLLVGIGIPALGYRYGDHLDHFVQRLVFISSMTSVYRVMRSTTYHLSSAINRCGRLLG